MYPLIPPGAGCTEGTRDERFELERRSCIAMKKNCPYIVRCNECEFVSDIYLDESLALNERDFHGIETLHSVSIWRRSSEAWSLVTELMGVELK